MSQKPFNIIDILPYVKVDSSITPPFCVDGRVGERKTEGPYPQALGGSFHFVALRWLLNGGYFNQVFEQAVSDLKNLQYPIGFHRDTHGYGENAGCGFADHHQKIITTLKEEKDEIWGILTSVDSRLGESKNLWEQIIQEVGKRNLTEIPSGEKIISLGESLGGEIQVLEGEHQEQAAVVNLEDGTTLDVDSNQDHQAFNLDLWYVLKVAQELGIDIEKAKLLSLGLYVATEMVLVEGKGKQRLPILIHR